MSDIAFLITYFDADEKEYKEENKNGLSKDICYALFIIALCLKPYKFLMG